jgi:predicted DNA repair protein MutK
MRSRTSPTSATTDAAARAALTAAVADPAVDLVAFERDKIRGAIRTDFILSAEIMVITLGTVAMFLVGGGILAHALHLVTAASGLLALLRDAVVGVLAGALVLGGMQLVRLLRGARGA